MREVLDAGPRSEVCCVPRFHEEAPPAGRSSAPAPGWPWDDGFEQATSCRPGRRLSRSIALGGEHVLAQPIATASPRSSGTLVERFTNGGALAGKTQQRLLTVFRECRESARRHVSPPRSRNGFLKRSKQANETVARMSFDRPANETHSDRMDARFPCGPHEKLEPQTMDGHESRGTGTRWAGTPRFS